MTEIDFPAVIRLPDQTDWVGLAIERLDINRLPENLRKPASRFLAEAIRRRGATPVKLASLEPPRCEQ